MIIESQFVLETLFTNDVEQSIQNMKRIYLNESSKYVVLGCVVYSDKLILPK